MGLWDGIGEFFREITLPEEVARGIRKGDTLFQSRDFTAALRSYEDSLLQANKYAPLHVKKGMTLFFLDDYVGAIRSFDRALSHKRNDRDALFWKGKTLAASNQALELS